MIEKISAEIKRRFFVDVECFPAAKSNSEESCWQEEDSTYFRFSYQGESYIGVIRAVGEQTNTIVALLVNYFETQEDAVADLSKNERWKSILLGEGSARSVYRFMAKFSIKNGACFALAIQAPRLIDEAVALLAQYGENGYDAVVKMDENSCALVR